MSSSHHVYGIKPPDSQWKRMKAVWDACHAAAVPMPNVVAAYFGEKMPDESGAVVTLDDLVIRSSEVCIDRWDVPLSKLDPDIKIVRFEISY